MTTPFLIALCAALALLATHLRQRQVAARREAFIRHGALPAGLFDLLRKRHPQLTLKQCQLVAQGLRQFFLVYLKSRYQPVSMPSQVVDDLWHEFILHTRNYDVYCRKAFGRFLHHVPAATLGHSRQGNTGLRRCWLQACRDENINPRKPSRLPLLFALDAKLAIAGGFHYVADCSSVRRLGEAGPQGANVYCGGDFASSGFDGGTDGLSDSDSGSAADGGDGSSGGGCSSGCGGD